MRLSEKKTLEIDPKCFKDEISFAVTNRGQLIPCCRCDDPLTMNDPEFKKLLAVSKISEYNSIDEILDTKEWMQFYENLKNHIGPDACRTVCKKNKSARETQVLETIDPNTKEVLHRIDR